MKRTFLNLFLINLITGYLCCRIVSSTGGKWLEVSRPGVGNHPVGRFSLTGKPDQL